MMENSSLNCQQEAVKDNKKANFMVKNFFFIKSFLQMCLEEKWLQSQFELMRMNWDHFMQSISRNTNVEVSASSPSAPKLPTTAAVDASRAFKRHWSMNELCYC